jgi:hypothetical protein
MPNVPHLEEWLRGFSIKCADFSTNLHICVDAQLQGHRNFLRTCDRVRKKNQFRPSRKYRQVYSFWPYIGYPHYCVESFSMYIKVGGAALDATMLVYVLVFLLIALPCDHVHLRRKKKFAFRWDDIVQLCALVPSVALAGHATWIILQERRDHLIPTTSELAFHITAEVLPVPLDRTEATADISSLCSQTKCYGYLRTPECG